jgi:hypothetical protein
MDYEMFSSTKDKISHIIVLWMYYFYPSAYMRIIEANKWIAFAMREIKGCYFDEMV